MVTRVIFTMQQQQQQQQQKREAAHHDFRSLANGEAAASDRQHLLQLEQEAVHLFQAATEAALRLTSLQATAITKTTGQRKQESTSKRSICQV